MTRWNVSTSVFTLLQLLLTLSTSTTAAAFSFRARRDGESHKNHIHRDINGRQEIHNTPFAGLGMISNPGAGPASTLSPPLDEQFETISAINANGLGGPASPPMTSVDAVRSNGRARITSFAPPVFPSTVLQIPFYTICPGTPGYLNATSSVANATAPYSNLTAAGNATDYLPLALSAIPVPINATVLLSNGSYTTFSSQSLSRPASPLSTSTSITPAPDARIILGTNGCQILYSALTTQICSTVITRGGQVPISVTDCSQWVTFSSSSATVALTCNCANIPATNVPTAPTSPERQIVSGELVSETITPAADSGISAGLGLGITFYAAPWYEIAGGLVPGLVQVANCPDNSGNNCSTASESWSVSTSTSTTTSTRTLQYAGPAILTRLDRTVTTSVSYSKIYISTHKLLIPTIVRAALAGVTALPSIPAEKPVTVQMTVPYLRTWELEQVHETTQARVVITVTVPGTVVYTDTITKLVGT